MFPMDDQPVSNKESAEGRLVRIIAEHGSRVGVRAAAQLGISRQAVNKHLRSLVNSGIIHATGQTRAREYKLFARDSFRTYKIGDADEGTVWGEFVAPKLVGLKKTVGLAQYAFTEIYNNAIEHSEGTEVGVSIGLTAASIEIIVRDNGIGIFRKLVETYGFEDEREAVIELVKGKLTTDRDRHTGWGIFYSSRMCDIFSIFSGRFYFSRGSLRDWCFEDADPTSGTMVHMRLDTDPEKSVVDVLKEYSTEGSTGLDITHVPLKLATHGEERLVSRSQAKQIAYRFDLFREVVLDFDGVDHIGQAFADELFRVWQRDHPSIQLVPLHTSDAVTAAIDIARARLAEEAAGVKARG
jgi:DNA-binding Lrp family transcriptional regulator